MPDNNRNNGQIFMGVFLLTIGVLFLFNNYNQINFDWWRVYGFWPLILIVIGVMIIFGKVIRTLSVVVIAFLLAFFAFAFVVGGVRSFSNTRNYYFGDNQEVVNQNLFTEYNGEQIANFKADLGVTDFNLKAGGDKIVTATSKSNFGYLELNKETKNGEAYIALQKERHRGMCMFCNFQNRLDVQLNSNPSWKLDIDAGASDMNIDLSELKVDLLKLDVGASSVDIKIGNRQSRGELDIDAGATSLKLRVPKDSVLEMRISGLIGKDFSGLTKIEDGLYRSDNFDVGSNKIFAKIDGLTSLEIIKY